MPYDELARELFEIMDPEKRRPPHQDMNKMMHGEMAVMRLLEAENRPLLAGEISRKLSITTARVAAVLGGLERKGMIERKADPADKRRVAVHITSAGCAFNAHKRNEIITHMRSILVSMGEQDAREYVWLTRRAFELMQCTKKEGGVE